MAYFEWGDDLSVGNDLLDRDHRNLIGLVNSLHSATSRGDGRDVVGGIIAALIGYTQDHFQREERHMEAVRYPKREEHRRQHGELLDKVLEIDARFREGHVTVAAEVSALLRDWLSIHIRRSDREFATSGRNGGLPSLRPEKKRAEEEGGDAEKRLRA